MRSTLYMWATVSQLQYRDLYKLECIVTIEYVARGFYYVFIFHLLCYAAVVINFMINIMIA